jgi:hypothetical protein
MAMDAKLAASRTSTVVPAGGCSVLGTMTWELLREPGELILRFRLPRLCIYRALRQR